MRWSILLLLTGVIGTTARAQMPPAMVEVVPVERRVLDSTQLLVATVEPVTRAVLAAEEEGLVAERFFDEGQPVEKGAVLTRTKIDLLEVQRQAARAALASANAMIARAQADETNAQREADRLGKLVSTQVISEKEYRDAVTALEAATAMVAVRRAESAEKSAMVDRLALLIAKAELKSPLSGVVAKRHVEVGQWIKQGDPVAEVVQLDPLFVRVNVPEGLMASVRQGDSAMVVIDALRRREFHGKVEQILPEADPLSRTFTVKILVPNPKLEIRPGFFARARLTIASDESFVVPKDAIVPQGASAHVVVRRNGVAAFVPVQRGQALGNSIIVTGELVAGEEVVIRGNEGVFPGQPLMLRSPPAPAAGPATPPATRPAS